MAAVIGSVAAVKVFLQSDEDDDLEDIKDIKSSDPIVFQHPSINISKWFLKKIVLFVFSNLMTVF